MISRFRHKDSKGEHLVVSAGIQISRNLNGHRFISTMEPEETVVVESKIIQAVDKLFPGRYAHSRTGDSMTQTEILLGNQLLSPELQENSETTSVYLIDDANINLLINEDDHLKLQVLYSGMSEGRAFGEAIDIIKQMESELEFAFHPEFGYLTSSPTETGTGIRMSAVMHLPTITFSKSLNHIRRYLGELGIDIEGLYGEGDEALGDLYRISSQKTLGIFEKEAMSRLRMSVNKLTEMEQSMIGEFAVDHQKVLEDYVFGAINTVKSAKTISLQDAMRCISSLRTGVVMGIFRELNLKQVTDLFLNVQSHSINRYNRELKINEDEDRVRAIYLDRYFKEVEANGQ